MRSAVLTVLSLSACYLPPPNTALDSKHVFEKLSRATVIVRIKHPEKNSGSQGSGTVIGRRNGSLLILTAAHVFGAVIDVTVVCSVSDNGEGPDVEATVLAVDHDRDLALLSAPDISELSREPISVSRRVPDRFATLYEMSSPDSMPHTAVTAILTRRGVKRWALYGFAWPGASGGTLADERGELVGVIVGVTTVGDDDDLTTVPNVWYAVSLNLVHEFLANNRL